jgi:two-component system chemotaxis sensor kinase CheA
LVDQLLNKQEVVIKTLGEVTKHSPALAGAAILGDGRVGLILDVNTLVKLKDSPMAKAA